ncbi:O-antigen ligase family protein [Intrasporangium flavum]|uniref:O-antigen ligase family protein n=1 Tax=Intrasporangium flavum TaxID=1428657 RepID=UPI001A9677F2|nr:O-antigen ligase family protein [Intrasporangium flavum]
MADVEGADGTAAQAVPGRTTALPGARGPRRVAVALTFAICALPLLIPSGPGNTGLADVGILAVVVTVAAWLRIKAVPVSVPYLLPVGLLMMAGAVAAYHSGDALALLPVVQDVFLLVWCACIANAVRQYRWLLAVVLRAWVWSGLAWAAVLCVGKMANISWMAGLSSKDGGRASLTFADPNLCANYFLIVVALILATSVVRGRWARALALCTVLLAIVFTGSNGAAIGLGVMIVVALVVGLVKRRGVVLATAVACLAGASFAAIAPNVDLNAVGAKASDSIQVLRDSLGRTDESSGSRTELATETFGLYLEGDLLGVGPGRTKATLSGQAAPYIKEAHNDYLATLVERGAVGGVGLAVLLVVVAFRVGRVALWPQDPEVRALVPRPQWLLALCCALAVAGLFYEVLHFRHVWALFGLIAGLDPGSRGQRPYARVPEGRLT